MNIYVTSLSAEFVLSRPAHNNVLSLALLWASGPPLGGDIWKLLQASHSAAPDGAIYRMPTLALQRSDARLPEYAASVSRTSTLDEVTRLLTTTHLRSNCSAQTVLQSRCTTIRPAPVVLIPDADPRMLLVGMDAPMVLMEYLELRSQVPDRTRAADDPDADAILVPVFRRRQIDGAILPTLFGYWVLYFMDVAASRREHCLPEPADHYAADVAACALVDTSGDLAASIVSVPRRMVAQLYTSLLAPLAEEASARLLRVDHAAQSLVLLLRSDAPLDGLKVTFSLSYCPLVIMNDKLIPEPLEHLAAAPTAAAPSPYSW